MGLVKGYKLAAWSDMLDWGIFTVIHDHMTVIGRKRQLLGPWGRQKSNSVI